MRFSLMILTVLPTLLISPPTFALPNPPTPNQLLPRTTDTITVITSLVGVGLKGINLDKAVRSFTPDGVNEIRARSLDLEHSLDQAQSTAKSVEKLDALSSNIIAGICTPLKPLFSDLLKAISDKVHPLPPRWIASGGDSIDAVQRSEFFAAKYGDDMLKTLISLRIRSRALALTVKFITMELDGAYILFLEDLVDKQYELVIEEYKKNKGDDGDDDKEGESV
ncbi:uncharacterized protein BO80DRAFT_445936 [Aspergillus ibericus CBS 121593]|uniref:Antigenic cell wall galactomanno protein n=1 Tax=Aspergillus ibericus CBS 121593 TaxID=1448316 RepID=A0A395GWG3_9EURO|nr:hypothetical protein BO80DRAFT_445936 [Aspergillus ibericus CBS 121593]RAK99920.1 hypothetical protein BO80DRAFT_445936 [Aspergillus ibericus CBS 121593]